MMEEDIIIAFVIGAATSFASSILLVAGLNRTGLPGKWVLSGFTPVVALFAQVLFVFQGILTPSEAALLFAPLGLLPYLILAFKSWPVAATHVTRPES